MIDVWCPSDRPEFSGPILLDTHVWIWYLERGMERMSTDATALLRRVAVAQGALVSDISFWEIGLKSSKGRLALAPTTHAWLQRASHLPGFSFLPIDRATLIASTELPGNIHGDPADRLLITTASLASVPLATADPAIIGYARSQGGFSVCDVRA